MPHPSRSKSLTVNEALDILFSPDSDDDEPASFSVVIEPPLEDPKADTDQDTDKSDDEVGGNLDHLPRRILATSCNIDKSDEDDLDEQMMEGTRPPEHLSEPPVKKARFKKLQRETRSLDESTSKTDEQMKRDGGIRIKKKKEKDILKWSEDEKMVGSKIKQFLPAMKNAQQQNIKSPLQSLQKFLTNELIDHTVEQSLLYATQKNYRTDSLTKENILAFIGILLVSGYNKLPYRRLYWALASDVHNDLISKSLRRDTFDAIMRSIHFANYMEMTDDKLYKVRPLFEHFNTSCKDLDISEYVSVDETIVPYYGHHGLKQFIRGKPIRFGYKLWVLSSSDGILFHAEPYCGASTNLPTTGLGQGADVVLGLLDKCKVPEGTHVVMDNFFTGIPLLKELSKRGIAATGTLRENRQMNAPLTSKKQMKNKPRGQYEYTCNKDIVVVKRHDNTAVTVASNKVRTTPCETVSRWSSSEKKKILVPMPQQLKTYNKHMGGVDLFDQSVANYRIRIRSKKWWWSLFSWVIGASVVNAWRLYRNLGNDISLLDFTRQCAQKLLGSYGTLPSGPGKPLTITHKAKNEQRFDEKNHWIVKSEQKHARCKNCSGRTGYKCEKCNQPLHPECHKSYHVDSNA